MQNTVISDSIRYIGVDDKTIDLFEGQYPVPGGISYNSYLILDEKIAVMDTVDPRKTSQWLANLAAALEGRTPDYLVISHMEPDHAGSIQAFTAAYPTATLVGNAKTFPFLTQFAETAPANPTLTVAEGQTLSLGAHTLQFFMAPMVHWPEVMVTYEQTEKVLFSADAFGKFGALDTEEDWACEARRYYFNIVGKYGAQVQAMLKKTAGLDLQAICPLHGPILRENLGDYLDKYNTWSSYVPEDQGVFLAYVSLHGNTGKAVEQLADLLRAKGVGPVVVTDLARGDVSKALEDAFRYDRMVLASVTYDGGLPPAMEDFLYHLKAKAYQNRRVGFLENGTWAPMAAKHMKAALETCKQVTLLEPVVTLRSTLKPETESQLEALAAALAE